MKKNVKDILEKLVSFNTIDDKENEEINNYIKEFLKEYGFSFEEVGDSKKVLIARTKKEPKFCFFGHTDTVSTNMDNPFKLVEKDGNLYGLGTCDMKSGIASILKAITEINIDKLKYGLVLVFTYGEETDFNGIKEFVKNDIKYPEYILVGEPTDNIPMNGSKGAIAYYFNFYGKKAHSSRIEESSNINCIKFFSELLKLQEYFNKTENSEYEFKNSTMNIGIINGGTAINVVSDKTAATCDFRITSKKEEYDYVKKYVEDLSKKYNMDYTIGLDILPFINESDIVNVYEEITCNKRGKFYGLSEASLLNGNRIILGPGPVTAHQDDEHISIESLNECVEIYKKIINYICK